MAPQDRAPSGGIDKLDYRPGGRPLSSDNGEEQSGQSHGYGGRFFDQVAEGIADRDRAQMRREAIRYTSFGWAIISWYRDAVPHHNPILCTDSTIIVCAPVQ